MYIRRAGKSLQERVSRSRRQSSNCGQAAIALFNVRGPVLRLRLRRMAEKELLEVIVARTLGIRHLLPFRQDQTTAAQRDAAAACSGSLKGYTRPSPNLAANFADSQIASADGPKTLMRAVIRTFVTRLQERPYSQRPFSSCLSRCSTRHLAE